MPSRKRRNMSQLVLGQTHQAEEHRRREQLGELLGEVALPAVDERVDEVVHACGDVVLLRVHAARREQRVEQLAGTSSARADRRSAGSAAACCPARRDPRRRTARRFFNASSTSARLLTITAPPMPIAPWATSAWFAGCGVAVSVAGDPRDQVDEVDLLDRCRRPLRSLHGPPRGRYTEEALPLSYRAVHVTSSGLP